MKNRYMDACMNATRQRILQVVMIKKEATSAEIGEELPDIPRASLYRHIKVLLDAGIIEIIKEEHRRGSVEKTYTLAEQQPYEGTNEEYNSMIQTALMGLQGEFYRYFQQENQDPYKDLLTVSSAALMLSDTEMKDFLNAYATLIQKYMKNKPDTERKVRKITLVVSPNE